MPLWTVTVLGRRLIFMNNVMEWSSRIPSTLSIFVSFLTSKSSPMSPGIRYSSSLTFFSLFVISFIISFFCCFVLLLFSLSFLSSVILRFTPFNVDCVGWKGEIRL